MVGGLEDSCAVIDVKAEVGLLAGTGINCRGAGRGKGDGAHGQGSVCVSRGSPRSAAVGGAPDAALRATDQNRIPSGVAGVHGDGLDPARHGAEEAARCGRGAERRPRSANGRARLWDHSGEAAIRPANELAFGFHHALHVLESLQARASGDVPAGIGALLVEPLFALP